MVVRAVAVAASVAVAIAVAAVVALRLARVSVLVSAVILTRLKGRLIFILRSSSVRKRLLLKVRVFPDCRAKEKCALLLNLMYVLAVGVKPRG